MTLSRRLALFVGTITPAMERLRRRYELTTLSALPFWIDDILLGAFLLYGAWRVRNDPTTGQPYLAAAWAFMLGLTYYSFFGQLQQLSPDPSGVSAVSVLGIKGIGLLLGIAGLVTALHFRPARHIERVR